MLWCLRSRLHSKGLSNARSLFQLCIPDEVKMHVFSFLTTAELCTVALVSKDMKGLALDDVLWMKFFIKVQPKDVEQSPPARVCHSAVVHGDCMYIYGGHIPDPLNYIRDVKNDFYAYHFSSKRWELVTTSTKGDAFPSKTEHTAVVYKNCMYLFGGYSNGTTGYSDVYIYEYNFDTRMCTRVEAGGTIPPDRSAHTAVVYKDAMYILGGWDGDKSNNDFYVFHFPTRSWSRVDYVGTPPPSVRSHSSVVYKDTMIVFGGYGENAHPTRIFVFHFLENRWEELVSCPPFSSSPSSSPFKSSPLNSSAALFSNGPCGRSRFRMVYSNESLWVFGGWDRQAYFADLWRYRLATHTWHKVEAAFELKGVGQHSLVVNRGRMYLYGGYCSVSKAPHPHLYIFRLPKIKNAEA